MDCKLDPTKDLNLLCIDYIKAVMITDASSSLAPAGLVFEVEMTTDQVGSISKQTTMLHALSLKASYFNDLVLGEQQNQDDPIINLLFRCES